MKVLITGVAGRIGTVLAERLGDRYELSGFDRRPSGLVPTTVGDLSDRSLLAGTLQGMTTVIHLAADPRPDASWEEVMADNIEGTQTLYELAVQADIERVIFASSNHVVGGYEEDEPYASIVKGDTEHLDPGSIPALDHRVPIRPDCPYGVSKAFGEAVARYHADQDGLSSICLRIGSVLGDDDPSRSSRIRATWLSHRDLAHLIECCIEVDEARYEIVYGVSDNRWRFWDIEHARRTVGYQPRDGVG